jgi:hypothetical protein
MPFVNPQSHIFRNVLDNISIQLDAVMTVSCDDIITLNATLIGDLTNHTFLWEQLTGTPVIWLEPQNQQTVLFQQPAVRDNKVFKFTLDRGTSIVKSRQILVSAVPTDILKTYLGYRDGPHQSGLYIDDAFSDLIPSFRPPGSAALNDIQRAVLVTNSKVVGSDVLLTQLLNGNDVIISTTFYNDASSVLLYLNGLLTDVSYKFYSRTNYEASQTSAKSYSSLNFITDPDLGITDDTTVNTSIKYTSGINEVLETVTRTIESTYTSDSEHGIVTNLTYVESISNVLEVIERQLVSNNTANDMLFSSIGYVLGSQSVVEVKAFEYSSLG